MRCSRAAYGCLLRCDSVEAVVSPVRLSESTEPCNSTAAQMSLAPAKFETKGDKYDGQRAVWGKYAVAVLETRAGLDA